MKQEKARATRTRFSPVMIVMCVILCLYVLSLLIPFIWAFFTSFKSDIEFEENALGLPQKWVWNYGWMFTEFKKVVFTETEIKSIGLWAMFGNSLLYSVGSAFAAAIVPCITAYLCARFKYKFSSFVYGIVIVTMVLPIVGNQPSQVDVADKLHVLDTVYGLWLFNASFLGLYFLVFYNVFKALPRDFTEAAKIDGANNLQFFIRVILPVIRNTLLTIMLIKFIDFWNDYQAPLLLWQSSPTVAYGLYWMSTTSENGMNFAPKRMTASMIVFFPIIIIFLLLQKRLLGNLTVGGIKG